MIISDDVFVENITSLNFTEFVDFQDR